MNQLVFQPKRLPVPLLRIVLERALRHMTFHPIPAGLNLVEVRRIARPV